VRERRRDAKGARSAERLPAAELRRERPADTFGRVAGRRVRRRGLGERESRRVSFDAAFEPENRRARPLTLSSSDQFRLATSSANSVFESELIAPYVGTADIIWLADLYEFYTGNALNILYR
jgi:hypothetical protein